MKNSIKLLLMMLVSYLSWACTNEDLRVTYPRSTPSIDTAVVAENQIAYGDSIHLHVAVSEKVAPLSTVEVMVVVNNEVVAHESVRTKGYKSSFDRTYGVPFVANRPDNAAVKVYLSSINVEGYTKDSIINTTIAKRPEIKELWIVPDGLGTSYKLSLTDAANYLYSAKGLNYGTSVSYKLATKVNAFKRVDWTGLVFGKVGDGIGLIHNQTDPSITTTDETLVSISEFTFDALKFKAIPGGKLLEPVKTLDINADLAAMVLDDKYKYNFRGGNVYLGEGVEVTFTGITNLASNLAPDYFEVTGVNTAKFLGKTGLYKAYYLISAGYLYIEPQPEAIYPDALWVCGSGFSRPQVPYTANPAPWNWNSPIDYAPCRLISPGIYQVTMYCKNEPNTDGNIYGKCDFKFFHKRGWWDGHELWVDSYTLTPPFLGPAGVNGNVKLLNETVLDGIYRFTVNENNKTFTAVKLN